MKILYNFFSNRFFILSRLDIVQSVLEVMNICNLHNYSVYSELHEAIEFNKLLEKNAKSDYWPWKSK